MLCNVKYPLCKYKNKIFTVISSKVITGRSQAWNPRAKYAIRVSKVQRKTGAELVHDGIVGRSHKI